MSDKISGTFDYRKCTNEFEYQGTVWNQYTTPEQVRRSEEFEFLPTDIVIATYPRSGTTLTQEIIWQVKHRTEIFKGAKYGDIDERFPFLEFNAKYDDASIPWPTDVLQSQRDQPYRLIKTHCPYSFLKHGLEAAKPKLIVVMRNPKDTAVSMFNFYRGHEMYGPWDGDFTDFLEIFTQEKTFSGGWFTNNLEWWALRDQPNVLILRYEDLLREPHQQIRRVGDFLEEPLTPNQLDIVVHNTRFANMHANENVNTTFTTGFRFLRKGIVGDWRNYFTINQNELMDSIIKTKLAGSQLVFTCD